MRIVLGTAQLDGRYGRFSTSEKRDSAGEVIRAARALGFSALDTAADYEGVETQIGAAGWDQAVHTKISRALQPQKSLERSLGRLRKPRVDILYFHDSRVLGLDRSYFSEIRAGLSRGKALHLGVSVYTPEEFLTAVEIPELEAIQIPLNLVDRRFSPWLLQRAKSKQKLLFARSIFLQGALLARSQEELGKLGSLWPLIKRLESLTEDSSKTRQELLLGWVKASPWIDGVVIGAETTKQLTQLSKWFSQGPLSEREIDALSGLWVDDLGLVDPRNWR